MDSINERLSSPDRGREMVGDWPALLGLHVNVELERIQGLRSGRCHVCHWAYCLCGL